MEIILKHLFNTHPNPAYLMGEYRAYRPYELDAPDITNPEAPFINSVNCLPHIRDLAHQMLDRNFRMPDLPESPRTKPTSIKKLPKLVTRAVRKSIVKDDLAKFPSNYHQNHSGPEKTLHYNIMAVNQTVLDQIPPSSIAAIVYFKAVIVPGYDKMVRFQHPGQIISTVRKHLDIDPSLWRWFLRTSDATIYTENKDRNRIEARIQAALLCDANRPNAHPERVRHVLSNAYTTRTVRHMPIDSEAPWQAWVRAVNLYLEPQNPPTSNSQLTSTTSATP